MARTPKRLAGPQLIDSTAETVYTAPAGGAVVKNVIISNNTGSTVDVTLSVGSAATQANRVMDNIPCPDGLTNLFFYWPLGNGETLQAQASTDDTTTLTIGGDELS